MASSIDYTNTKTVATALDDLYNLKTATVQDMIDTSLANYTPSSSVSVNYIAGEQEIGTWTDNSTQVKIILLL